MPGDGQGWYPDLAVCRGAGHYVQGSDVRGAIRDDGRVEE
jgi:hypothetical protein